MGRPAVIGITGPAGSGKDTLCRFIIAEIGGYRYSFADPIRAMMKAGFGIDMSDPYWVKNKEHIIPVLGKSPRQLMQTLGTEWGRDLVDTNIWLTLAANQLYSSGPGMIIADARFDNEAAWIRKKGVLVHIHRNTAPAVSAHPTEAGIPIEEGEPVFENNGHLEELQMKVKDWLHVA